MLNFLFEIDSVFAAQQFDLYKNAFVDDHFGISFIREYPDGESGNGDIDSGPVIWDIGSAATIVGRRTLQLYGKTAESNCIRNCIEIFGFPIDDNNEKYYLLQQLLMADAFIAWANSHEQLAQTSNESQSPYWKFHGYSLLLISALIFVVVLLTKRQG